MSQLAGKNLLDGPAPTYLPDNPELGVRIEAGDTPQELARTFPKSPLAWALLAEETLAAGRTLEAYAYARVGYHRGLDALRSHGWRGHGPIPVTHQPNRGFLKTLLLLEQTAASIGETDEAERVHKFLNDSDPSAASVLAQ